MASFIEFAINKLIHNLYQKLLWKSLFYFIQSLFGVVKHRQVFLRIVIAQITTVCKFIFSFLFFTCYYGDCVK